MAAPNILNLSSLYGKTAVANVLATATTVLTNSAASNKVYKVNSLTIANIDGTNDATIDVDLYRSSVAYHIASDVVVAAGSTLVVTSKENGFYMEEGDSVRATANTAGDLQAVLSYEELS